MLGPQSRKSIQGVSTSIYSTKKDNMTSFNEATAAYTHLDDVMSSIKNTPKTYSRSKPGLPMVKIAQLQGDTGLKDMRPKKDTLHLPGYMHGSFNNGLPLDKSESPRPEMQLSNNLSFIQGRSMDQSHWQSFIKDFPDLK